MIDRIRATTYLDVLQATTNTPQLRISSSYIAHMEETETYTYGDYVDSYTELAWVEA